MRASLFLSALFCASLIGGSAAAEKPEKDRPLPAAKAPKELRTKGDMFERHGKASNDRSKNEVHIQTTKVDKGQTPLKIRQAAERIRCSEASEDCGRGSASKSQKSDTTVAQKGASNEAAKLKAVMQKMLASKCGARARGGCSGHDDPY